MDGDVEQSELYMSENITAILLTLSHNIRAGSALVALTDQRLADSTIEPNAAHRQLCRRSVRPIRKHQGWTCCCSIRAGWRKSMVGSSANRTASWQKRLHQAITLCAFPRSFIALQLVRYHNQHRHHPLAFYAFTAINSSALAKNPTARRTTMTYCKCWHQWCLAAPL